MDSYIEFSRSNPEENNLATIFFLIHSALAVQEHIQQISGQGFELLN